MISRRNFLKTGGGGAVLGGIGMKNLHADVPVHRWDNYDFGAGPMVKNRLNQGPFGIDQDEGWRIIASTSFSNKPVKNFGLGLVGYTWEENGPSLAAREGRESLQQHVEKLASLPFVDVLYIRCDWRNVQKKPGSLELDPIWKLTFEAAKKYNLRVGCRIQLSSPNFQPQQLSLPDFLKEKVQMVNIGKRLGGRQDFDYYEPRYDLPEFQDAFRELNELLADELDGNPLMEFFDLMMYGFWGEGHTNDCRNPFPDYLTAEKTFINMTQLQLDAWKKVPLAVNTQPDISNTGNREVIDMCVRNGCWLRSDSILNDEPIQIERLSNRPPWLAVVMEQGGNRHYRTDNLQIDEGGINYKEKSMLHTLDLGGNYWSLWTEADNLRAYHEKYPDGFDALQARIGYRVRPSWVWQRKRYDTSEVVLAIANDGVAGVPGILRVYLESMDGKLSLGGGLDPGHPYGGRLRQCSFILPQGFEGKQMKLRAEIEVKGVLRPIRWACAQPLNKDGTFTIQLKKQDDPGWRKGI
jgi:hypothetical protein